MRNLLRYAVDGLIDVTPIDQIAERIIETFFMQQEEPISILYRFLSIHQDKIGNGNMDMMYGLRHFRDFCLIKSMPKELHTSYVAAFSERSDSLGSQTENKRLIAIQLAAVALEVIPFSDSVVAHDKLRSSLIMAYAIELDSNNWSTEFSKRTCDHVFTWGEPPIKDAVKNQQFKDFVDDLIENGIKIDSQIEDDIKTRTKLIAKWLARERKVPKYYIAVLPERNRSLVSAILADENLRDLIVVSCPEHTTVDLAMTKDSIDRVNQMLGVLYREINDKLCK